MYMYTCNNWILLFARVEIVYMKYIPKPHGYN